MQPAPDVLTPPPIATEAFTDAAAAVARLDQIYQRNTAFLRDHFESYASGAAPAMRVRATYPFVRITNREPCDGSIRGSPTASSRGRACTRPA
jgi:AMP nucleosidase